MLRRLWVLAFALLLFAPHMARAQDAFEVYGSDDPNYLDMDNGPTLPQLRMLKGMFEEFNAYNMVDVSTTCALDQFGGGRASGNHGAGGSWDDPAEDDWRCSRLVEVIATIAGLRGSEIADLVVAYCIAATVVQEFMPQVLQWLEDARQEALDRGRAVANNERMARNWTSGGDYGIMAGIVTIEIEALEIGYYVIHW